MKNVAFHSLRRWRWLPTTDSHYITYTFSLWKVGRMYSCWGWISQARGAISRVGTGLTCRNCAGTPAEQPRPQAPRWCSRWRSRTRRCWWRCSAGPSGAVRPSFRPAPCELRAGARLPPEQQTKHKHALSTRGARGSLPEIRGSAVRSPRFCVSGYCTKWRIEGH